MISKKELENTLLNACTDLDGVIQVVEDVVTVERMPDKEAVLESLEGISWKLWDIYDDVFLTNAAEEDA